MTKNKLIKCTMSKFQYDKYKLLIKDIVREVAQNSSQNLINFIYPIDNKDNVFFGEEGLENAMAKNYNSLNYSYKSFNTGFVVPVRFTIFNHQLRRTRFERAHPLRDKAFATFCFLNLAHLTRLCHLRV